MLPAVDSSSLERTLDVSGSGMLNFRYAFPMAATPLPALRGAAKSRRFCRTLKDLPCGFNGAVHATVSQRERVSSSKLSEKCMVYMCWLAVTMANNRSEPRQVESAREEVSVLVTARTVFQKEGRVTSTWWVRNG